MSAQKFPMKGNLLRARVKTFGIPPVHDGLVIGRESPIGCEAFKRALALLSTSQFDDIDLDDEVISDVLIRSNILLKISREKLIEFLLARIKPLMSPDEILHLDLEYELTLEEEI